MQEKKQAHKIYGHKKPVHRKHDHKVIIVSLIIIAIFTVAFFLEFHDSYIPPGNMKGSAASLEEEPFSGVPVLPMMDEDDYIDAEVP